MRARAALIIALAVVCTSALRLTGQVALLEWPLPPGGEVYADIDGRHLHTYVVDQAAICDGTAIRDIRSSGAASRGRPATRNPLIGSPAT